MKEKIIKVLKFIGLGFFEPLFRLNEKPKEQLAKFAKVTIVPLITFFLFLFLWNWGAEGMQNIQNKNATEQDRNIAFDKAIKQLSLSEEEAKVYADSVVKQAWYDIHKKQHLDNLYDDLMPKINEVAQKKIKNLSKEGIKINKREIIFSSQTDINNQPMIKSSLIFNKTKDIGQSSSAIYILFTDEDVKSLPEEHTVRSHNGIKFSLTANDLFEMYSLNEYRYMYEMKYLPRPKDVWKKWKLLINEHEVEKQKEADFYAKQNKEIASIKNSSLSAEKKEEEVAKIEAQKYPGYPTFFDQIYTSIYTVLTALLLAGVFAVPVGIFMGLSPVFKNAINPLVQLFKPVSPVVWYMIVAMVVNALIDTETALLPKSFTISFISVAACANWATMINTSFGVASVNQDLLNVASVLQIKGAQKIFKVILPSAIPMIFTGLRITVTTSWMVLIAVELLAQNPGLGKFVWDEFQNGSSNSNGKIVVAMFVIGIIGFILDRIMLLIQKQVSFDKKNIS